MDSPPDNDLSLPCYPIEHLRLFSLRLRLRFLDLPDLVINLILVFLIDKIQQREPQLIIEYRTCFR